ncbi:hypothetical protein I4U23_012831 [Adineta vaga]|nr:hypothetical protein I4U23_012831 [Adineta vaga]
MMSCQIVDDFNEMPPTYSRHQHACIMLSSSDKLRLLRFPSTIIDVLRQAIMNGWSKGIQRERTYENTYEFKLHGNPWWGQGNEAVPSRMLMTHILAALYNYGWYLLASADISKSKYDKDSLIFQLGVCPTPTLFFSVSFNEYDKLRLICAPPELIPAVQQALGRGYIQREGWRDRGAAYQFKLRGTPWLSSSTEGIHCRMKLLALLDCFTAFGWKLYASVDISEGYKGQDTDSWFLRREL